MFTLKFLLRCLESKNRNNRKSMIMFRETCMPRSAKMKIKRKRRRRRERMEDMAFIRATTRFLKEDQYLGNEYVL